MCVWHIVFTGRAAIKQQPGWMMKMTHTLTKNGKTAATITKSGGFWIARLHGPSEGMVASFSDVEKARKWAEVETSN